MPPKTAKKYVGPGRRGDRTRGAAAKVAAAQPDPPVAPSRRFTVLWFKTEKLGIKMEPTKIVDGSSLSMVNVGLGMKHFDLN
ncbi:hypothetical protein HanPSC8_Chr10g0448181 [Helianthus annuus]|nr:hypothetical protein HanIR_Chr10g0500441 [Helianthus annuus]KAJ0885709.1 hypothetical protein HanPSC8_Chr10g0448181 [Helianthus annuus]